MHLSTNQTNKEIKRLVFCLSLTIKIKPSLYWHQNTFITKEQTALTTSTFKQVASFVWDPIRTRTSRSCCAVMIKHKDWMKSCTIQYLKAERWLAASRLASGPGSGARAGTGRRAGGGADAGLFLTGSGRRLQLFPRHAGRSGPGAPALGLVFGVAGWRARGWSVASAAVITWPVSEHKTCDLLTVSTVENHLCCWG